MRVAEGFEEPLAAKFTVLFPHLDERQRRLLMGAEARAVGHGGGQLGGRAAGGRAGAGGAGRGGAVISVDTKKKEKVGDYANPGGEYQPKGRPVRVRDHDFPDKEAGKAVPYGVYDVAANTGWVSVGADGDTAAFAVESIRRWWRAVGRGGYPPAPRLLNTADARGSNAYRHPAWKTGLAAPAAESGLDSPVCHFPRGTSKG